MRTPEHTKGGLSCNFCSKSQYVVEKLIAGPHVFICNECIDVCRDIVHDNSNGNKAKDASADPNVNRDMLAHLDAYVIGQDTAKKALVVATYTHMQRLKTLKTRGTEIQKSNVLLLGPTGSGKTMLLQTLAKKLDVPFVIADATKLTSAGYVGRSVEDLLNDLLVKAGHNKERAERGIIYIDEIDKIATKQVRTTTNRDISGEGVQEALLQFVEGKMASLGHSKEGWARHGSGGSGAQQFVQIDTTNILFIAGGAFVGLEKIISDRVHGKGGVGIGAHLINDKDKMSDLLSQVEQDDLIKFGMLPELVGRFPSVAVTTALDVDALKKIMTDSKKSPTLSQQSLMEMSGIDLDFSPDAITAIAERAIERGTGGRGLNAIIEKVMLEITYEYGGRDDIETIVVTADTVRGGKPLIIPREKPEPPPVVSFG